MDLVTDMLVEHVGREPGVEVSRIRPTLPPGVRELASSGGVDRDSLDRWASRLGATRSIRSSYPGFARASTTSTSPTTATRISLSDCPGRARAFSATTSTPSDPCSNGGRGWRRALARTLLAGLRRAAVVFYSTEAVRLEIEEHGLVDVARLVAAPYGIAEEFQPDARADDAALRARRRLSPARRQLDPPKEPAFPAEGVRGGAPRRPEARARADRRRVGFRGPRPDREGGSRLRTSTSCGASRGTSSRRTTARRSRCSCRARARASAYR